MPLKNIETYWHIYQNSLPENHPHRSLPQPEAWGFGNGGELADELGKLVCDGIKTATCSMLWDYEKENSPIPAKDDLSIILDARGTPICIIETVEVEIRPFNEVQSDFAYDEGEGDRSLAYWREAHLRFFGRTWQDAARPICEDMPLVCERFCIIYPLV